MTDTCTCCRWRRLPKPSAPLMVVDVHSTTIVFRENPGSPLSFFGKIPGLLLPTSLIRIKKLVFINWNKSTWQVVAVKMPVGDLTSKKGELAKYLTLHIIWKVIWENHWQYVLTDTVKKHFNFSLLTVYKTDNTSLSLHIKVSKTSYNHVWQQALAQHLK